MLKADGYAGLTTAKVAARSGQNKALIHYHFGSKQGLVAAAAREVARAVTEELLAAIAGAPSCARLVRGLVDGIERIVQRDEGLARVYFDLASQSVVDPEVRAIMQEVKQGHRRVLSEQVLALPDGPSRRDADAASLYLIAGLEGLTLELLATGETPALRRARGWFLASAPGIVAS